MNAIDVVVAQYEKTILEIQRKLAQAAVELMAAHEKIEEQAKELDALKPKDAPKLEAVKDSA